MLLQRVAILFIYALNIFIFRIIRLCSGYYLRKLAHLLLHVLNVILLMIAPWIYIFTNDTK